MKCLFGILLLSSIVFAADSLRPLDVRPGTWEVTTVTQMSGVPPIPPEVLAKMTPEQRAMIDARIQSRTGGGKPTVRKQCVRKEDLTKPLGFINSRDNCKVETVDSSGSKLEIHLDCDNNGIKTTGTVRIEALDPEHVKVTSQIAAGAGPRAMNVNSSATAKWVTEACEK